MQLTTLPLSMSAAESTPLPISFALANCLPVAMSHTETRPYQSPQTAPIPGTIAMDVMSAGALIVRIGSNLPAFLTVTRPDTADV